jgi:hypothetical protein
VENSCERSHGYLFVIEDKEISRLRDNQHLTDTLHNIVTDTV